MRIGWYRQEINRILSTFYAVSPITRTSIGSTRKNTVFPPVKPTRILVITLRNKKISRRFTLIFWRNWCCEMHNGILRIIIIRYQRFIKIRTPMKTVYLLIDFLSVKSFLVIIQQLASNRRHYVQTYNTKIHHLILQSSIQSKKRGFPTFLFQNRNLKRFS